MNKVMKLSKFKACICEGAAERAILDILLENDLLIFGSSRNLQSLVHTPVKK